MRSNMSGFKRATVSISQDEYNRLRDVETKFKALPEPNEQIQQIIQEHSLTLLQTNIQDLQDRENQYKSMISGMDNQIQNLEISIEDRLRAQETAAVEKMSEYAGNLWMYFDGLLEDQNRHFSEMIAEVKHQNHVELSSIVDYLVQGQTQVDQKQDIAEAWESMVDSLFMYITDSYAHEFFMPGIISKLDIQIQQTKNNLYLGLFEAAVSNFQTIYLTLADTRLQLEQQHQEWNLLYQTAFEAINYTNQTIENSAYVQAIDLDGNELDYLVDVNYWTQNGLVELAGVINRIGEKIFNDEFSPSSEIMLKWLTEDLPQITRQIEDMIVEARIKAINSQLRINVADLVIQALHEQGFTLSGAAYQSNDARLGYGAQLTNIEGNEVIVRVTPSGTETGENELQIESLDSDRKTEHELRQRWMEISKSLRHVGLNVGPFTRDDGPAPVQNKSVRFPARANPQKFSSQAI